jgi:serpin B
MVPVLSGLLLLGACGGNNAKPVRGLGGSGASGGLASGGASSGGASTGGASGANDGGASGGGAGGTAGASVAGDAGNAGASNVTELRSDEARVIPEGTDATPAGAREAEFGLDLLQVVDAHSNLAFSPHSLSTAFAMLSDAADGQTLTEIQKAFAFGSTDDAFNRSEDALELELAKRNRDAYAGDGEQVDAQILTESNDIWVRLDLPPASSYLDTLARYFGAGIEQVDFANAPEDARLAINAKVSADTHHLIPELIPEGAIDPNTVAVLTNALYFKAPWATAFDAPSPGSFTRLDGSKSTVDMLSTVDTLDYYAGNGFVAVAAPYYGGDIEMLFVVPDAGSYDTVRAGFTSSVLDAIVAGRKQKDVLLTLPKFSLDSALPAVEALKALGIQTAFDPNRAEFPPLTSAVYPRVYVSDVLHQATVAIDEKGTEASAATAIVAEGDTAIAAGPTTITIDRPFLFLIRDNPTGAVLFVGQVVDP